MLFEHLTQWVTFYSKRRNKQIIINNRLKSKFENKQQPHYTAINRNKWQQTMKIRVCPKQRKINECMYVTVLQPRFGKQKNFAQRILEAALTEWKNLWNTLTLILPCAMNRQHGSSAFWLKTFINTVWNGIRVLGASLQESWEMFKAFNNDLMLKKGIKPQSWCMAYS